MQIDLDQHIKTIYGNVLRRPTIAFTEAISKYSQLYGAAWLEKITPEEKEKLQKESDVPMSLGYLLIEALPSSLPEKASQNDQLTVGKLQRRIVKGGTQNFTADEVSLMKRGASEFLCARNMQAIAVEVLEVLDPAEKPAEQSA